MDINQVKHNGINYKDFLLHRQLKYSCVVSNIHMSREKDIRFLKQRLGAFSVCLKEINERKHKKIDQILKTECYKFRYMST